MYLYMDCHGGHCVLNFTDLGVHYHLIDDYEVREDDSEEKEGDFHEDDDEALRIRRRREHTRNRTPLEKELNLSVWIAEDFESYGLSLEATTFEEFLVQRYFDEWATFFLKNYGGEHEELPAELKEWLIRVYSEDGRKM
jgi:hypothetical protein